MLPWGSTIKESSQTNNWTAEVPTRADVNAIIDDDTAMFNDG